MKQNNRVNSFLIVGGGTAGWISAAILSRAFFNLESKIHVIESPNVPTIGVGEATIPSIIDMLQYLRIPLRDFINKTNASFKLGIKFVDWHKKNEHYWHQFGHIGHTIDGKPFYQHWLKHRIKSNKHALTDFSPAVALAKQNRFHIPDKNRTTILSTTTYALHFDASLVAAYLEDYCKKAGVIHTKAHVNDIEINERGDIASVQLESGENVGADFFIDCSGQRALLIQKALRVGYDNWAHFLPVNKAIAAQSEKQEVLKPYTESTAHEHGWRWQIPLQNRTGNGYVFCDDYCSDDEALALLKNHVPNLITEPRLIKFQTGKRNKIWHRNCLAVGLSSGFLEPLESTSIYLIMRVMLNFVQSVPSTTHHEPTVEEFNRLIDREYCDIRDFIVLHYCESKRTDSPFWRMWQHLEVPDSLKTKLELFKGQGRLYANHYDLFSDQSWYAVLEGMGVRPKQYDPIIDASIFEKVEQSFDSLAYSLSEAASKMRYHSEYLNKLAE